MSTDPFGRSSGARPSRRGFLAATSATLLGGTAGCLVDDGEAIAVEEGFEAPLGGWESDGHVGPDAGGPFDWSIERTDERARTGAWSLAIFTEGRYDDGTAWIERPIEVDPGRSYRGEGRINAWSASESFNEVRHLVAYLGVDRPTAEGDFPGPNGTSTGDPDAPVGGLREPLDLAEGWREYAFAWESPPIAGGTLHFAVGVTVVWETDRSDYLDDVTLDLHPA